MGSRYYQRPENAISKADEFIKVGKFLTNDIDMTGYTDFWISLQNIKIDQHSKQK